MVTHPDSKLPKKITVKTKCNKTGKEKDIEKWEIEPYDLVALFIQRVIDSGQTIEKKLNGWWDGGEWNGYKLKPDDKVLGWQRCKENF